MKNFKMKIENNEIVTYEDNLRVTWRYIKPESNNNNKSKLIKTKSTNSNINTFKTEEEKTNEETIFLDMLGIKNPNTEIVVNFHESGSSDKLAEIQKQIELAEIQDLLESLGNS